MRWGFTTPVIKVTLKNGLGFELLAISGLILVLRVEFNVKDISRLEISRVKKKK
jgi:hypothetical protein